MRPLGRGCFSYEGRTSVPPFHCLYRAEWVVEEGRGIVDAVALRSVRGRLVQRVLSVGGMGILRSMEGALIRTGGRVRSISAVITRSRRPCVAGDRVVSKLSRTYGSVGLVHRKGLGNHPVRRLLGRLWGRDLSPLQGEDWRAFRTVWVVRTELSGFDHEARTRP